jgi:hypothetical protein
MGQPGRHRMELIREGVGSAGKTAVPMLITNSLPLTRSRPIEAVLSDSGCEFSPAPDDMAPTYPPDFPKAEGREAGLLHGCEDSYYNRRKKQAPRDFCPALILRSEKGEARAGG